MKLLLFSEDKRVQSVVWDMLESSENSLQIATLSEMTATKDFSQYDAVITDKKTWQRNAVFFKYFDCLENLNETPLLIINNDNKIKFVKNRDPKYKSATCAYPIKHDDFFTAIEKLLAIPANS